MKRILITIITALITISSYAAYTVDNLPVSTQFRDSLDFNAVTNPDGVLNAAEVDSLNSMLWSLRQHQGVQGFVIAIKESDPDDPYEFTMQVARKYGVGGKQSLGFVMLVTTDQRGYQIISGDGMEKFLTDAQCSVIGRKVMVPAFREGQWGRGLIQGLATIKGICTGEIELNPDANSEDEEGDLGLALLAIFGPVGALGGVAYYVNRKNRTCPKCKKHHYTRRERVVRKVEGDGKSVEVLDKYQCSDCNYTRYKKFLSTTDHYYIGVFNGKGRYRWGEIIAASATGVSIGSGFGGGHSSGGGSFHSTFGGGSFSGGGAGGRF